MQIPVKKKWIIVTREMVSANTGKEEVDNSYQRDSKLETKKVRPKGLT